MIYEIRTYDIKPGSLPEVEKRFAEAYRAPQEAFAARGVLPYRDRPAEPDHSYLGLYKDLEERARIRAAAIADKTWPPKTGEFLTAQRSDIFIPAPFSPEFKPGKGGPYFEMRTYTYAPGALPNVLENWGKALPDRIKLSPLVFCGYSELGGLNKWLHIWSYPTLDARNNTRDKAKDAGIWPPSAVAAKTGGKSIPVLMQENKIVMPAKFSPVQ